MNHRATAASAVPCSPPLEHDNLCIAGFMDRQLEIAAIRLLPTTCRHSGISRPADQLGQNVSSMTSGSTGTLSSRLPWNSFQLTRTL